MEEAGESNAGIGGGKEEGGRKTTLWEVEGTGRNGAYERKEEARVCGYGREK